MSKSTTDVEVSDADAVARFRNGDQAAFDGLVEKYSGKAFQIAYGVLGNREDAEEVSQDVFIRIHRALQKFRGDAEFSTWMYRITLNLARNKYRWNKSRGSQKNVSMDAPIEGLDDEGDGGVFEIPAPKMTPSQQAQFSELENSVSSELNKLAPLYRQALVMRNMDDMNYEQIAEILGCKLGTIKSRIARAREELRKRLNL
jgi:RNA polymerase sigma-70 factor (ECF subfamily)